jgi:uncharacterized protein YrrD
MQFRKDANVLTATGDKVGEIERVVVDPRTKEVTHLVVRKGFIFTEDKVVPVNLIASAQDDTVRLREDAGDLEGLPDFIEEHFVVVDERELARTGAPPTYLPPLGPVYWYPPFGNVTVPAPVVETVPTEPPYIVDTERNIPEKTVALKEGAEVISADDEHVGDVELVLTEPEADQVTHFVISQGLLLKERKLIPYQWVNRIDEERVYLVVSSRFLENLPEYHLA